MNASKIVVAVDGSADAGRALTWSVAEARAQGRPLHIVHCVPHQLRESTSSPEEVRTDEVLDEARSRAEALLGTSVCVQRIEPFGLDVGPTLLTTADPRDTLVVGARGHTRIGGLLIGSVSQYCVRHAAGPVVVVREPADAESGRTVVGVDGSASAHRALDWALSRADRHAGKVVAVRAWRAPTLHGGGSPLPLPVDAQRRQEREQRAFEDELEPWHEKWPNARLRAEAIPGHAASIMSTASSHAELVVMGAPTMRVAADVLPGSVGPSVLHRAACSVAVVR